MLPSFPQLGTAVLSWSQKMTIGIVAKSQQDFKTVESVLGYTFMGVLQPLSAKQIEMKPEGERGWRYVQLHSSPVLQLQLDDVVILEDGYRYRVIALKQYDQYGYMEYELVRGFENL